MTAQGPPVRPPIPLLVKSQDFATDETCSLVRDVDLDECSEHEVDALKDLGLFDLMKALVRIRLLQVRCPVREALVKHLKARLASEKENTKKVQRSQPDFEQRA